MPPADQSASDAPEAILREVLRFHQQGGLEDAERFYIEVLQNEPANFDAVHPLGVAIQSRRTELGFDLLTKAIGLNPNFAPAHNHLGKALSALGRHEEALASFERAIVLKPDFAEAYNNRGSELNILKRHVEAIASHEKAIALQPDFPKAQYDYDTALADLSQWKLLRWYKSMLGVLPRLHPPKTFNERITHRIIYDRDPRLKIICDKLKTKQFISERVGSQHVVPLLGAWEDPGKIGWDRLPERFVLKPSHLCGPYAIIIKSAGMDIGKLTTEAQVWLGRDYFDTSLEWGYRGIPRRVMAEPLQLSAGGGRPPEALVYTFSGKAALIRVLTGRKFTAHQRQAWFDATGRRVAIATATPPLPDFALAERDRRKLIETAERLSEGFSFLRVDTYLTNEGIRIGELTPYPNGGRIQWKPDDLDEKLGHLWDQPPDPSIFQSFE